MTEIIFEVTEDEVDGGYSASALGHGIHTQGESVEEIRSNVKEAVDCYFDDTMPRPKLIRLHFVPQKSRLRLTLNLYFHELNDPRKLARDVTGLGRWGTGNVQLGLSKLDELPYVMGLGRQTFEK